MTSKHVVHSKNWVTVDELYCIPIYMTSEQLISEPFTVGELFMMSKLFTELRI